MRACVHVCVLLGESRGGRRGVGVGRTLTLPAIPGELRATPLLAIISYVFAYVLYAMLYDIFYML